MKKCNVCQLQQADENNFCVQCGSAAFTPCEPAPQNANTVPAYPMPAGNGEYRMPVMQTPKKNSKGLVIGLCAGGGAAVLVIVGIILAVIFLNPVTRFLNSMEEGDYIRASEIYHEHIAGNFKRDTKVHDALVQQMEGLVLDFEEELIPFVDVQTFYGGVSMSGAMNEEIYMAYEEANRLHSLRVMFAEAESAFAGGDYVQAIMICRSMNGMAFEREADVLALCTKAMDAYREAVLKQARNLQAEAKFEAAMGCLQEGLNILAEDPALLAGIENCVLQEHNYEMQQYVDEAMVYASQNDYPGALNCLDNYLALYPEEPALLEARANCLETFEVYVAEETLRLAQAGEYQHAVSLAASGLNYFTSARVSELLNICKSYIPVSLGDMEMFQNNSEDRKIDAYTEDNYSNKYAHSLSVDSGEIVYLVNFKYSTLSGTVAFPKGLESDSYRANATLRIFGDGTEIAKFENIDEASSPAKFTLDVSTYERVSLQWTCEGANIWNNWCYFATIFDGELVPIELELPETV